MNGVGESQTFKELIGAFADDFGADKACAGADGAYEFDIDDFRISFSATADGRSVLMMTSVGYLPDSGREHLFRTILESFETRDAACSLEPGGDRLFLQRTDDLEGLDVPRFEANLESFVNRAIFWRRLLAGYGDVAGEQEKLEAEAPEGGRKPDGNPWDIRL